MARLNKMEITAIAEKIENDIRKEYNIKIKNEKDRNFNNFLVKFRELDLYKQLVLCCSLTESLNVETKDFGYNSRINIVKIEDLERSFFDRQNKIKQGEYYININDIIRDIIVAQAKNKDIDKLIKELTGKYTPII